MYNLKYTTSYKRLSNSLTTINIEERDYTGSTVTELIADADPLVISTTGNVNNIYEPTIGAGATVKVLVNPLTVHNEFFTTDPQKFRVKIYNGDSGGTLIFVGFISTGIYNEDYSTSQITPIVLEINDGMKLLEDIPYMIDTNTRYTGTTTIATVLNNILGKINIDFSGILTNSNLDVATDKINPFIYLNVCNYNFYDENDLAMSCRQVLNSIFQPLGLIVSFRANTVYLIDPINLHYPELGRSYDMSAVSVSVYPLGGYKDMSGTTLNYFQTGQNLDVVKPFNAVDVKYGPYTFINSLYSMNNADNHTAGSFSASTVTFPGETNNFFWASGITFTNWQVSGTSYLGEAVKETLDGDAQYYLKLIHNAGYYIDGSGHSKSIYVDSAMGRLFGFQHTHTIDAADASGSYSYVFPFSYTKEDDNISLELKVGLLINTRDFKDTLVTPASSMESGFRLLSNKSW
jgi:hypothetical protein